MRTIRQIVAWCIIAAAGPAWADPVTFYTSFAGNVDFQVTGASLRTQPNTGDACAVTAPGTPVSATLSGIPAGAAIRAAYLYWAGSGATPDNNVVFQGSSVVADRTFSETFTFFGTDYDFFSGFADVTALVTGNGSYGLSGLSVYTGNPHCASQAVVGGWSLVVVFEHTGEPLRVVNIFDGLTWFRGSRIDLTPGNFEVPAGGCSGTGDCKFGVITWEGDVENSASLNGFAENLYINPPPPPAALADAVNPPNNQFNSTISITDVAGPPNTTSSYGLDLDVYTLSTSEHLSPGDTSAVTRYESGADLVLLNAEIFSVRNTPVADLAIDKSHSGDFTAGQQGQYTLSVSNNGPNDETGTVTVTDTLPGGLSYLSAVSADGNWNCGASGQDVTCTHPGPLPAGGALADITLTVDVDASAAPSVINTANVSGTAFDNVSSNDSDDDPTNVLVPDLSTSTKSVLDINGGEPDPGDVLRYTITINESGGAPVNGVSVSDSIDSLLENFSVVSIPAGATDNSAAGTGPLDVSGIDLPAGGSTDIVFEAAIVAGASPGDLVDNTAVIVNPVTGGNVSAAAPTVTVSPSQMASTGVKNLYTYFNNDTLSRVVPSADTNSGYIAGNGGAVALTMTPSTRSALTLGSGAIQIPLCMDRNNPAGGQGRDITVTLDYVASAAGGSTGTIGSQTQNGVLTGDGFQLVTFSVDLASDLTLNADTALRLTVSNSSPAGNRQVQISSLNCSIPSQVQLNANTVVNVDSASVFSSAYPGTTTQSSYGPSSDVFIRAVVSDPFGSFDITGADIEIVDADGATAQSSTAMTEVADSGVATKTYEFQYTVPASPPGGTWTANITAREGTEGTVTDLGVATFLAGSPELSVVKLISTLSDPVNGVGNPKAIPGALIEYRVNVTNSGVGPADADSVVITDSIDPGLQLYLGNPADPVQFADGSVASGLSFTFTSLGDAGDDVDFSNDGGGTFVTPSVDAGGYDVTSPPINYIRVNPQGRLNGSTGSGDPSFDIRFRARVR